MPTKTIVVTGVSRGLGRALVDGFAELGHSVLGCARSTDEIANMQAQFPQPHRFDAVDVTDCEGVGRWANELLDSHGAPDLLINNAAMINQNNVLWEIENDHFSDVVDVNIKGTFHVIRAFLPAMIENGVGVIANLSSGWGRSTSPEVAPYCATKWAIEGLTRALSQELPRGLAAVPVNPGVINTDMLQSSFGNAANAYPTPGEWAKNAVPFFLELGASDNGSPLSVP